MILANGHPWKKAEKTKKLLAKGLIEKYTLETNKKEVYFIYSKKINNTIYFDETNYLMPDGIHLSLEGNKKIIKILKDNIK